MQPEKISDLILLHYQEEDHLFIHDTLKNKNTQLVSFYNVYKYIKMYPEQILQIVMNSLINMGQHMGMNPLVITVK